MHDERESEVRALGVAPGGHADKLWRKHLQQNGVDPDSVEPYASATDTNNYFRDALEQAGIRFPAVDGLVAVAVVAYRAVCASHASDVGKHVGRATRATPESGRRHSLIPLRDALGRLPGPPMTIGALRKASTREGFPKSRSRWQRAKLYDLDELVRWKSARDAR